MTRRILGALLVLGLSTPLAQPAFAQGRGHGAAHAATVFHRNDDSRGDAWARQRDRDDDRFDRDFGRDRREHKRLFPASNRPPGWSHGHKTGWGNCDVPPGQAKKYGCHSFVGPHGRKK